MSRGRLSDSFGKAKKAFREKNKIPKWISKVHWNSLLKYWDAEEFSNLSNINSRNRNSSSNGDGPSLHTRGSVAFVEYRKRHKLETRKDIFESELYLKTHKTKDQKWICGKSKRVWNMFARNTKQKLGEGAQEEDVELNEIVEEMEEETRTNNDVLNMLSTIPEE